MSWPEFNYGTILQRFGPTLNEIQVQSAPFGTPPGPIRSEGAFQSYFYELVRPRIRRALRAGFEHLAPLSERRLVSVTLDYGSQGMVINNFKPDTAFLSTSPDHPSSANRAPGDLKVSWKWRSSDRYTDDISDKREYQKVMAQVNFYMSQHGARHGFVLTNTEFVAIKRLDTNGLLAVADPIPWTSGGIGQPSVLLGLWYLGMLAAEEDTWSM